MTERGSLGLTQNTRQFGEVKASEDTKSKETLNKINKRFYNTLLVSDSSCVMIGIRVQAGNFVLFKGFS